MKPRFAFDRMFSGEGRGRGRASTENRAVTPWAPAFAGALSRGRESGFTLVEMMVVITIIGLAAAAIVLTLPAANGGARAEATRFAARVASLRDRAVIEGRGYGVWMTASGYGFERRAGDRWAQVEDGRLSRADWRSGTAATVNGQPQGRVSFDRVGLPDRPATLSLQTGGDTATVTIDAAGEVSVR